MVISLLVWLLVLLLPGEVATILPRWLATSSGWVRGSEDRGRGSLLSRGAGSFWAMAFSGCSCDGECWASGASDRQCRGFGWHNWDNRGWDGYGDLGKSLLLGGDLPQSKSCFLILPDFLDFFFRLNILIYLPLCEWTFFCSLVQLIHKFSNQTLLLIVKLGVSDKVSH